MRTILIALIALAAPLAGCSSPTSAPLAGRGSPTSAPAANVKLLDGQTVKLLGQAAQLPNHADKANGVGITIGEDSLLFVGEFRPIPAKVLGATI